MTLYQALDPNTEVSGSSIMSVLNGMPYNFEMAKEILEKAGISNLNEEAWYPQQGWLNVFKEIEESFGRYHLQNLGSKISNNTNWPADIRTLENAIRSINIAYHMNHRINGKVLYDPETGEMHEGIGHYHFQKLSEMEYLVICDNPYPCDFDKGIIKGLMHRFRSTGKIGVLRENERGGCRNSEAKQCIYRIQIK